MDNFLALYREYKEWIDLIKDAVFFAGAYTFFHGAYLLIKYLRNKKFEAMSAAIENNLKFREKLEPLLNSFIFDTAKGTKDIAIRFVYWKNYPWNLTDDAYKFHLYIKYLDQTPHYGWIDNTGVNFQELVWWYGNSVYIDKDGIFFLADKDLSIPGFEEFKNAVLVRQIPFTNIINYDFRQRIEYEPVFYVRYPYNKWKRLYNDNVILRNKEGHEYLAINLSQRNLMRKYSKPKYYWFKARARLLQRWKDQKHIYS